MMEISRQLGTSEDFQFVREVQQLVELGEHNHEVEFRALYSKFVQKSLGPLGIAARARDVVLEQADSALNSFAQKEWCALITSRRSNVLLEMMLENDARVERYFTVFGGEFNALGFVVKDEHADELAMRDLVGEYFGEVGL